MPFTLLNRNVKRLASSTTNNSDLCKSLKFVQNQITIVTGMYSLECFTVYVKHTPSNIYYWDSCHMQLVINKSYMNQAKSVRRGKQHMTNKMKVWFEIYS